MAHVKHSDEAIKESGEPAFSGDVVKSTVNGLRVPDRPTWEILTIRSFFQCLCSARLRPTGRPD